MARKQGANGDGGRAGVEPALVPVVGAITGVKPRGWTVFAEKRVSDADSTSDALRIEYAVPVGKWNEAFQTVRVRHTHVGSTVDGGEELVKYTVFSPLTGTNTITDSIRCAGHILTTISRVTAAIRYNRSVEKVMCWQFGDEEGDPCTTNPDEAPLQMVSGVDEDTVQELAGEFGTYYDLAKAPDRLVQNHVDSACVDTVKAAVVDAVDHLEAHRESGDTCFHIDPKTLAPDPQTYQA